MADEPAEIDGSVITFSGGIPGFPEDERFVLVEEFPEGAFQRLQSLDHPDVAMYVCEPWLFFPEYILELTDAEKEELALASAGEALVFCPVTLDPENEAVYVNLLGPFVVNAGTRRGRQLVLAGSDYPTRASVRDSAA